MDIFILLLKRQRPQKLLILQEIGKRDWID